DFLQRAARLGKRLYVVFNFQAAKAIADFRERFKILTGETLHDHRLVAIDYVKGGQLNHGPWVEPLREFLQAIAGDRDEIRKRAAAHAADVRKAGIPELAEVMAQVLAALRVPGIDWVYDRIFAISRGLLQRIRQRLTGDWGGQLRQQRDNQEAERLRRHINAF